MSNGLPGIKGHYDLRSDINRQRTGKKTHNLKNQQKQNNAELSSKFNF